MTYKLTMQSYHANGVPIMIDSDGGLAGTIHNRFATRPGSSENMATFVYRQIAPDQHRPDDPALEVDDGADLFEFAWRYILNVPEIPA
jgi:hypothetical protein